MWAHASAISHGSTKHIASLGADSIGREAEPSKLTTRGIMKAHLSAIPPVSSFYSYNKQLVSSKQGDLLSNISLRC